MRLVKWKRMARHGLVAAACLLCMLACQEENVPADHFPPDEAPETDFALGADISWCTEMEAAGARFYDASGKAGECTQVMKNLGLNAIRLRVWVDPSGHDGWCNPADLLEKALRARDLGMDLLVDFHYSDWWADPGKQNIPAAWQGQDCSQLAVSLAIHTRSVLSLLKRNGVTPKWVQVGNETSNGFLWPVGRASEHPDQYARLFKAGYEAVKQIFPDTQVLVHLDSGHQKELYDWNLEILEEGGARWDAVGMSVYPYWAQQSCPELTDGQVLEAAVGNMAAISRKYACDVLVVETGVLCAQNGRLVEEARLQAGKKTLQRLLHLCRTKTEGRCKGVFYWEPECKPSRYQLGAFTEDGRPTVIMEAFRPE